ncbi:hypothetical protein TCEA9_01610 [Thermobrachium celere]|nr:hypothetical protein TCEA9_01610 [Thermobrachium celere]
MDINKMTLKVQEALNSSQQIAISFKHQQVDIEHLTLALIKQEDGLIPNLIERMGININKLQKEVENYLDRLPKVYGQGADSGYVYATRRLEELLLNAEKIMKQMNDLYISVEHIFFSFT